MPKWEFASGPDYHLKTLSDNAFQKVSNKSFSLTENIEFSLAKNAINPFICA